MKTISVLVAITIAFLGVAHAGETRARILLIEQDVAGQPPAVKLEDELDAFFGSNGCELPKRLSDKLQQNHKKGYIPVDLQRALGDELGATVQKIPGTSVRAVLHTAEFTKPDGTSEKIRLTGPESYQRIDPMSLVDTQFDNFAYTMDCSGYLNAAISAGGGVKAAEAETAAKAALNTQKAMVAVRASVYSPIAMAMNPDVFTQGLSRRDRVDILYSLVREVLARDSGAADTTEVTSWRQVWLLWTSNEGSSSLQGKAAFSGSAGISGGVFSVSTSTDTAASIARSVSFSKFNTYILDSVSVQPVRFSLKGLRDIVVSLVDNTQSSTARHEDKTYVITFDLPKTVCTRDWSLQALSTNEAVAGSVVPTPTADGCRFVLTPETSPKADEHGFRLRADSDLGGASEFVLKVPIS